MKPQKVNFQNEKKMALPDKEQVLTDIIYLCLCKENQKKQSKERKET